MVVTAQTEASGSAFGKAILRARIMHVRFAAKPYVLRHRVWFLHVPLGALTSLNSFIIGYNTRRPVTLRQRDYGSGAEPLDVWVRRAFAEAGEIVPDGAITLLTVPRVFGIGFNPVSFWLCHNKAGQLSAVLAEVNNTFGERHCYLVRKRDGSPIVGDDELEARKVFHVSPFLPVDGAYTFRFTETADSLAVRVDLKRDGRRVMSATINGSFAPLDNRTLIACLVRSPLPAAQIVGFIHYHAARLYLRGFKYFSKPPPPQTFVSPPHSAAIHQQGPEPDALQHTRA